MFKSFVSVFIFIVIFYFLVFKGLVGNFDENNISQFRRSGSPFESSHETAPYALMLSLMRDRSLSLTLPLAKIASPDSFYFDKKYYIYFSPVIPLIMIPFYSLGQAFNLAQIFSFWGVTLVGMFVYVFMFLVATKILKLNFAAALLAMLVYGVATTSLSYATTIYQHQLTAGIVMGLFYCGKIISSSSSSKKMILTLIAAGLFILGFWLDYPNMAIMLPGLAYVCLQLFYVVDMKDKSIKIMFSNLLYFFIGIILIGGMGLAAYNLYYFHSATKIINFLPRYSVDKPLVDASVVKGKPINVLSIKKIVSGFKVLTISLDKGIFVFSPVLILAILGWWKTNKNNLGEKLLGLTVVANIFIYSIFSDPWGGWAFGPRYLIPSMAIMSMFSVKWLVNSQSVFRKLLFIILYSFSAMIAIVGALTTNLIPPSTEFATSGVKYFSFWQNFYLLFQNQVSAFVYTNWLEMLVPGWAYYFALILLVIFIGAIFVFKGRGMYEVENR